MHATGTDIVIGSIGLDQAFTPNVGTFLYVYTVDPHSVSPICKTWTYLGMLNRVCQSRTRKRGWGQLGAGDPYTPC